MDKPIPEAVELLRAFQSQFGARRPDEDEDDAETWDRIDAVCKALTAAQQQQGQVDVGAPRTPEQIAATVAWVQSLADSDSTPQPEQQDGVEAWNRERIEAVASRVERAGDKEAADLIRDLLEAGIEAEQERIDTAPPNAPVGVEGLIEEWESNLAEDKRDGVAEVAIRVQEIHLDQLRALAQQRGGE